jgi:hypothetical protein
MNGNAPAKPGNFLVPAVLSTLCCCLPVGIVAIIKASKVDGLYAAGDYAGAEKAAGDAKMWTLISAGLGLVINGIVVMLQLFVGFAQVAAQ